MKRSTVDQIKFWVGVIIICGIAGYIFLVAIGTSLTEETLKIIEKEIHPSLYEMNFDEAIQAAETIKQKAGRDFVYFQIVYRLAEAERFDEAKKLLPKIGKTYHRQHSPPLTVLIHSRFAETLAVTGQFDDARAALEKAHGRHSKVFTARCLLNADKPEEAMALLDEKTDLSLAMIQSIAAYFAKNGNDSKALEIAASIPLDGYQNGTYREIIREQLLQDKEDDAKQTLIIMQQSKNTLLKFRQQAAVLFILWYLDKKNPDEARKIFERFLDPKLDISAIEHSVGSARDPFFVDLSEWVKHADSQNKKPMDRGEWSRRISEIFKAFDYTDEAAQIAESGPAQSPSFGTHKIIEREKTDIETEMQAILNLRITQIEQWKIDYENIPQHLWQYALSERIISVRDTVLELMKFERREDAVKCLNIGREICRRLQVSYDIYRREPDYEWNMVVSTLCEAEIAVGQLDKAASTIKRLNVTSPESQMSAHRSLAQALRQVNRNDEAKEHALLALKFARRAGRFDCELVEFLVENGLTDEAQSVLKKVTYPSPLQLQRVDYSGFRHVYVDVDYCGFRPVDEVRKEREQFANLQEKLKDK
ncbi:MAG: hypothetical protein LBQ66_03960 [Planctomycetaceae bacterium]|jgi:hypothetical protein|nr:hypothetical protein [Planctomycetaceae bacterium]